MVFVVLAFLEALNLPRRNDEWNPVSVEKNSSGAKLASDMLFQFDVSKNG